VGLLARSRAPFANAQIQIGKIGRDVRRGKSGSSALCVTGDAKTVISNSGISLERSEVGDAKRVDPL